MTIETVFEIKLEDYIGNYWCELIQYPFMNVSRSSKVLAYKKQTHEFSLDYVYEVINPSCMFAKNCLDRFRADVDLHNDDLLMEQDISEMIRFMEITEFTEKPPAIYIRAIVHISTDRRHNVIGDFHRLKNNIHEAATRGFRSSEFCLPENFFPIWALTEINTRVYSQEICLQENGMPVTRYCRGDFIFGAEWGEAEGDCWNQTKVSDITLALHEIAFTEFGLNESRRISTLSESSSNLTTLDVYYLDRSLKKMQDALKTTGTDTVWDILKTTSNMMMVDPAVLKNMQELQGTTDSVLFTVENFYKDMQDFKNNYSQNVLEMREKNLLVVVSKPLLNNISGIAVYGTSFQNLQTKYILSTDNLTHFVNNTLLLAVSVPWSIVAVNSTLHSSTAKETKKTALDITIFSNDNLFIAQNTSADLKVDEFVVSISITGYEGYLKEPVQVWFKSSDFENNTCAFWDYSIPRSTYLQRKPGKWSKTGGKYLALSNNLVQCSYSHLTPFTLLVSTSKTVPIPQATNESVPGVESHGRDHFHYLNIITIVGSTLSVICIILIIVTAFILEKFRKETGTKILLHLSLVISLELILTQVADNTLVNDPGLCRINGIILHYVLLCKFSWILMFAVLQYRRFVNVMKPKPPRIVLKIALFAWGFPLFPVILSTSISPNSYSAGLQDFCYPKGEVLKYGVLLPVGIIVLLNFGVFIAIMLNICRTHECVSIEAPQQKLRAFCLMVLLVFMLDLPWIFGFLGEFFTALIFNYLFCILATLQGLVLFLFYIALNSDVRNQYYNLIYKKKLCSK